MKKYILLLITICLSLPSFSQRVYIDYGTIDIQKYEFHIIVTDDNNNIQGEATINLVATSNLESFKLDLENTDETNKGMMVSSISENGNPVKFKHQNNVLTIFSNITAGEEKTFLVSYHGVPKDGLVISKNKYGDRTFFGDNWPNRAHQWLPTVDHPSDKALVEWHVTAPAHYQVIGNGTQIEETDLDNQNTLYVWKTEVPIPTKVMVIGIARFAVQHIGETNNIPISSWVYPQNKDAGFYDYAMGKDIINFFIEHVGPYPYSKLANVQSKTRFGGMENASNIFYFENSVSGERKIENLIAHEIAHQWFGNSASESDWTHVWLSEGFATYFTNLYVENTKGKTAFLELVNKQRDAVIKFSKQQLTPVLDSETKSLMRLLNTNSYQKGAWVLHMLRKKVGDVPFWNSISAYYQKYKLKNASSDDLKNVFEEVTNQELDAFFTQWLEQPGQPILKTSWKLNDQALTFNVEQTQKTNVVFSFPMELKLIYEDDSSEIVTLSMKNKKSSVTLDVKAKVKAVVVDPNSWLLFEHQD
tara:strand:- start:9026 stop:10618 length:1593 start_codon:yes stop_codon:yes gene_type:complete